MPPLAPHSSGELQLIWFDKPSSDVAKPSATWLPCRIAGRASYAPYRRLVSVPDPVARYHRALLGLQVQLVQLKLCRFDRHSIHSSHFHSRLAPGRRLARVRTNEGVKSHRFSVALSPISRFVCATGGT